MLPWSQGGILYYAREGEAGSLNGIELPSEGGKRSCSPSEVLVDAKSSCFLIQKPEQAVLQYAFQNLHVTHFKNIAKNKRVFLNI